MKNSELNKLVYWAIKILKQQFEKDPYSLSSEELMAIKLYDTNFKEKLIGNLYQSCFILNITSYLYQEQKLTV